MAVEPTENQPTTTELPARPRRRRRRTRAEREPAETVEVAAQATLEAEFERSAVAAAEAVEAADSREPMPALADEGDDEPFNALTTAAGPAAIPDDEAGAKGRRRGGRRGGRGRRGRGKAESQPEVMAAERVAESYSGERPAPQTHALARRPRRVEDDAAPEEIIDDDLDAEPSAAALKHADREMIINTSDGDECRIAILQEGRLEELFIERQSAESYVGNIYSGRVTNVEPSIQAVFVDFGKAKNGFLHISDVQPQYFPDHRGEAEEVGKKVPRRDRPPIQKCFRRGDPVIVQVTKEGIGTKGPTLSTYLSIPGRYLVMMPGMSHLGVSRKIEDDAERRKMRDILGQLSLPKGMGFIVRTAGLDQTKRELQRDLHYLNRLWKNVAERIRSLKPPAELYQESDLVVRTIRDVFTHEFKRVVVDDEATANKVREFVHIAMPRMPEMVEVYAGREPLFHKFRIDAEIDKINSRRVGLPLGGSIVIDSTEALVAIDVNSGKFRALDDAEETAYKINLEAAEEIARQLRLRDLGGVIVCDFIDMRYDRHKRAVEKALRDALKKHKERARILRTSAFGLIEMTRQRQRRSITRSLYADCAHCRGTGLLKTPESMSLDVMRVVQLAADRKDVQRVKISVSQQVATLVLNRRRAALHKLETETGKAVSIVGEPAFTPDQLACTCEDDLGREVPFAP